MTNGISFQSGHKTNSRVHQQKLLILKPALSLNTWASNPHSFSTTGFSALHKLNRCTKAKSLTNAILGEEVLVDINSHLKVRFIMVSLRITILRLVSWEHLLMGLMNLTSTRDNSLLWDSSQRQSRQQKGLGDRLIMIKTGTKGTLKTAYFMERELTGISNTGLSTLIGLKVSQLRVS